MDQSKFMFLFSAVLQNASDNPGRQYRLLQQAVRRGYLGLEEADMLREKHSLWCTRQQLLSARDEFRGEQEKTDGQED